MNTKEIRIQIKNKIATAKNALPIVCDNSDYVVVFEFVGDDWAEYAVKTARFVYNGNAVDVVMTDDRCEIPAIHDAPYVEIGIYAGDVKTSTPAYVRCLPSITSHGGSPADPPESVYNQLMEKLNDLGELSDEELAAAIEAYFAENPVKSTFTVAVSYDEETDAYSADKTFDEIAAANNAGMAVQLVYDGAYFYLNWIAEDSASFGATYSADGASLQWDTLMMSADGTIHFEAVEAGQADWNQNDEYAAGYIKNRTHWVENVYEQLVEEREPSFQSVNMGNWTMYISPPTDILSRPLEEWEEIVVTYDGVEYTCTATPHEQENGSFIKFGNAYLTSSRNNGAEDTGEPFHCTSSPGSTTLEMALSSGGSHTFSIARKVKYSPLDERFISPQMRSDIKSAANKLDSVNPSGTGSFSMNREANSDVGYNSHAEGGECVASGYASHAEGNGCEATGGYAHAEGNGSDAIGTAAHAEGFASKASGDYSHAEGHHTEASGDGSHAAGSYTIAAGKDQYVIGHYNVEDTADIYAFIIGGGSYGVGGAIRKNIFTVDWYGNVRNGNGNIFLHRGDVVDVLTSSSTTMPLSAAQGKALKEMIDDIDIPDITVPTELPNPNALTIKSNSTEQSYNGSAAKSIIFPWAVPQLYGALGDGTTDDTAAIQSALANNRYVYIPAGTYKLSGTLNIRDGCRLELAPDAILNFTQTSGNCITLGMSAQLNGNFATLVVPYAFSGNVIYISTASSTTLTGVPPYTRWTPQWKPARYVSDICITKPDSRGFHYSVDGTCSGTAVYIEADGSATSTFIWGARLSGLRIAGAFSYGVHGKCLSEGWNHEMHLEAVIDACEIGVCLEDSNNNYITATIQPRAALTTDSKSVPYAKHGIQLIRCRNTDLSETRVWDWNATNALWTEGGEYQHIAMVGNCSGTILSDFLYYETNYDICSLIYTDTASNFEKMTILQEPFTRWFKPSEDGLTPYFYNGTANKELLQKDAFDALFQTNPVANFTNKLPTAATADGSVYNSVGYKSGVRLADADGTTEATLAGNTITGFIPCAEGDIIRLKGISFATNTYSAAKLYLYKSDHTKLIHINHSLLTTNGSYYNVDSYEATDEGCSFRIVNGSAAYFRLSVDTSTLTTEPVVTVNEEISYSQAGFLADSVSVKASSVYGLEDYIKAVIAANG